MNKKWRISILLTLIAVLLLSQNIVLAADKTADHYTKTVEYLPDGSYYEIEIVEYTNARSTITGASKTATYKNAAGNALWYVKVTANFYFNGTTSECTAAAASAGSYSDNWKIEDKYSSRSGNSATATAIAGSYMGPAWVGSVKKSVTLTCDKNGNLS